MARCEAFTKKKSRCQNEDATLDALTGTFLCHLHHPAGVYRRQVAAKHARWRPRPWLKSFQVERKDYRPLPETAPLKDRC